ncbi:MAG: MFS transporter [Rhodobacteraceae bacterium]|nr:MAG: MFS transporter [Paracoccaceae bacterium]
MSLAAIVAPAGRATAGFYAALFMAIGAHMPFWPLWLADWGLSESEVGLYLGLAIAARVGAGVLAPWFADFTGRRRTALVILAGVGAAAFLAHSVVATRPALLALTLIGAVAMAGCIPIGDALAAAAARLHGFGYAQMRAVGSAAFLATNLIAGLAVARFGPDAALVWIVASLTLLALFSARHPGGVREDGPRPRLADAFRLARARPFLYAAVASATLQAAHGPLYAYGSLHWRLLGVSEATIGALWAAGVAAEIALMVLIGGWITARLGPWGAFALSGAAGLARWTAMAFEPSLGALWLWQLTHALTFAPAHLGMIAFVAAAAPARLAASAQGVIGAGVGGATMAGATFLSAWIYPLAGAGVFALGVGLSAVGLAAALMLRRGWDGAALAFAPASR